MGREEDDFTVWRRQQENRAAPSPYIYPQMPPQFRWHGVQTEVFSSEQR